MFAAPKLMRHQIVVENGKSHLVSTSPVPTHTDQSGVPDMLPSDIFAATHHHHQQQPQQPNFAHFGTPPAPFVDPFAPQPLHQPPPFAVPFVQPFRAQQQQQQPPKQMQAPQPTSFDPLAPVPAYGPAFVDPFAPKPAPQVVFDPFAPVSAPANPFNPFN